MSQKKPLIAVVGPTASGKTDVGVQLALKLDGEVVSADSMLVYQGMDIGTAKPTEEEMQGVPHHMIDVVAPDEEYSVARYQDEAGQVIAQIHDKDKLPILVGGTGLYVRAVVDEYHFDAPGENSELREMLLKQAQQNGKQWLHDQLAKVDPLAAKKIHPNNVRRVIRALEVYQLTGKRISDMQRANYQNARYHLALFGLRMQRDKLYHRIDQRVDKMIKQGLVDEVKTLISRGINRSMTAMQALGYKEIAAYLDGEITLNQAIDLIKRDTRRFAKRQLTWFKRDPRIHWVDVHNYDNTSKLAEEIICHWQEKFSSV